MPASSAKHTSSPASSSDSLSIKRQQASMTILPPSYDAVVRSSRIRCDSVSTISTAESAEHANYRWWDPERDTASPSSLQSPRNSVFSYAGSTATAESVLDEEGVTHVDGMTVVPNIDGVLPIRAKKDGAESAQPQIDSKSPPSAHRRFSSFPSPDKMALTSHRRYPSSPLSQGLDVKSVPDSFAGTSSRKYSKLTKSPFSEPPQKAPTKADALPDCKASSEVPLDGATTPSPTKHSPRGVTRGLERYIFPWHVSQSEHIQQPTNSVMATAPPGHPCPVGDRYGCHTKFHSRQDARTHAKSHEAETIIRCSYPGCGCFMREASMKQHMDSHGPLPKRPTPLEELCESFLKLEFGMDLENFESPEDVTQAMGELCVSLGQAAPQSYRSLFHEYTTHERSGRDQSSQPPDQFLPGPSNYGAPNPHMGSSHKRKSDHIDGFDGVEVEIGQSTSKQARVDGEGLLPCPYRKRNPRRFNCRDHDCFKKGFKTMSDLKRHIKVKHRDPLSRGPYPCTRCYEAFENSESLREHIRQAIPCPLREQNVQDPEDGINWDMETPLTGRGNKAVNTWPELWKLLFPEDTTIPDPTFLPAIEYFEIEDEFDNGEEQLTCRVYTDLQSEGGPHEGSQSLAARVVQTTRSYLGHVIQNCYARLEKGNISEFRVQSPAHASPPEPQESMSVATPSASSELMPPEFQQEPVVPTRQLSTRSSIQTMETGISGPSAVYTPGSSNSVTSLPPPPAQTAHPPPAPTATPDEIPPRDILSASRATSYHHHPVPSTQPPPPQSFAPMPPQNAYVAQERAVRHRVPAPTQRPSEGSRSNVQHQQAWPWMASQPQFSTSTVSAFSSFDQRRSHSFDSRNRDSGVELTPPTSIYGSSSLALLDGSMMSGEIPDLDAVAQDLGDCNPVQLHNEVASHLPDGLWGLDSQFDLGGGGFM